MSTEVRDLSETLKLAERALRYVAKTSASTAEAMSNAMKLQKGNMSSDAVLHLEKEIRHHRRMLDYISAALSNLPDDTSLRLVALRDDLIFLETLASG